MCRYSISSQEVQINHLLNVTTLIEAAESITEEKEIITEGRISAVSDIDQYLVRVLEERLFAQLIQIDFRNKDDLEILPSGASGYHVTTLLNDIPNLNKFLTACNDSIKTGQYFIFTFQPKKIRSKLLYQKYPKPIGYPLFTWDFLLHRVLPKLSATQNIYFKATKNRYPSISISESLARIICAGFQIEAYKTIDNIGVIIAKKTGEPSFPDSITQGLIIKLPRVGRNGKIIQVYKLWTMHPYSEFLQEYLFDKYGTKDGDKIENDFRVTRWGKFFRKFWLDEIPMLLNLLKLELKLVGVRPLSKHKFYTYPDELQQKRTQVKPGLIPPYYADLPETPEEFFETERRYLKAYQEKPFRTDFRYFLRSMRNIIFRGVRSR